MFPSTDYKKSAVGHLSSFPLWFGHGDLFFFFEISEFCLKVGLHICKTVEAPYCMFIFLRWLIPSSRLSLLVLLETMLGPHCAVSLVISVAVVKILQQKTILGHTVLSFLRSQGRLSPSQEQRDKCTLFTVS